jgi:rubrerythrin
MKQTSGTGKNATGIGMSPIDSKKLIEYAAQGPFPPGSEHAIEEMRELFTRDTGVVGTVPPPSSLKGMAKMALDTVKGHKATVFIDKLSERAAFERTGARLYEAMLAKFDALGGYPGGPTRERLVEIRDEELEHLGIVQEAVNTLGGDPTVMTPAADMVGVQGSGLVQVMTDPRTTLDHCLNTLLVAELTDNDGWELLANLAEALGHDELAANFREALEAEEMHLDDVRRWIVASVGDVANADVARAAVSPP